MNSRIYLTLQDVSKQYLDGLKQTRIVLDEVNAEFYDGEIIAILGKSGSGKSTLLNLISGIDDVSSGKIFLQDIEVTRLKENQLTALRRTKIGFIFQFFNLLPTLTVWENICLPLELNGKNTVEDYNKAFELLQRVDMSDRKNDYPDHLSGGEQQRVAIARALVNNPDLILADEPTGNLDEKNGILIMELLSQLARQSHQNIILVTHSKEAAAFADRQYAILDGKLIETTSHAE
ncbi:MAG: ABC transporter ATP-binding protein [Chloroflexi bacterium HGW-Chloroflexi-10]|nr:MAG: ABC transporter ATP-binding protein [Chloroflexi bacterium HGW-Chloroflexi-10]